jgi:hypothetical protein
MRRNEGTMSWQRFQVTLYLWATMPRRRDDRGDVPGWVLVTVMTAGLVTLLYAIAGDRLTALLRQALNGVS